MLHQLLVDTGLIFPSMETALAATFKLVAAVVLGGIVGLEREHRGRAAGLRTHMMVALGAALFAIVPVQAGATSTDLAMLVKGIAAGIGFLGAGAILKNAAQEEIRGLTTASTIWLTGAVGLAAGVGHVGLGLVAVVLSLGVLIVLGRWEAKGLIGPPADDEKQGNSNSA
jgi:putative Mg2+ transporter-C (MgtC) family protein